VCNDPGWQPDADPPPSSPPPPSPQHVSNLALAFSRLTHAHRRLMDGLVAAALRFAAQPEGGGGGLRHQHLANLVSAAGMFGWLYPDLVR
jgi:hypothetical protein